MSATTAQMDTNHLVMGIPINPDCMDTAVMGKPVNKAIEQSSAWQLHFNGSIQGSVHITINPRSAPSFGLNLHDIRANLGHAALATQAFISTCVTSAAKGLKASHSFLQTQWNRLVTTIDQLSPADKLVLTGSLLTFLGAVIAIQGILIHEIWMAIIGIAIEYFGAGLVMSGFLI